MSAEARDSTSRRPRSAVASAMVVLALVLAAFVVAANPADAATTGRIIASPCLIQRDQPSTGANRVNCISYNQTVVVQCTAIGTTVSGPYGAENIWDLVTWGGTTGYVADAYVYTGTNGAAAGGCSAPPAPPPPVPSSSKAQRALSWLNARAGSTAYSNLCETMVENAYGTRGRYASALTDYNAQRSAGRLHTDTNIPAGALVFYRGSMPQYGHVEIAAGGGRYWTSDGTVHLVSFSWGGTYYGWSYAPDSWPGA